MSMESVNRCVCTTILWKDVWLDHMGLAVCLLETACAHACHCFSICGKSVVLCV